MKDGVQGKLQTIPCPHCGSTQNKPWGTEGGYYAVRCSSCRLVFVNPRPAQETITEANRMGVHATDEGALQVTARRDSNKIRHYRGKIEHLFRTEITLGRPLRWLDVGAGYGEVVEAALSALPAGSTALGVEPMLPKVAVAKQLGLSVEDKQLDEIPDGSFDVVSIINVYSHIPEFRPFLLSLKAKLAPGGSILLETGNAADIERAEFPDILYLPDHLVFGGQKQIIEDLMDAGFDAPEVLAFQIDSPGFVARAFLKNAMRGRFALHLPGHSRFRTLFFKAHVIS